MIITKTEWKKIACTLLFFTLSAALLVGAASATALPDKAETNRITGILVRDDNNAVVVDVQAEKSLTYTVTRVPDPLGVVFYFPGAALYLDNLNTDPAKTSGVIEAIKATEVDGDNSGSRLEILLKTDTLYDVTKGDQGIGIAFTKAASEFVGVAAASTAATMLKSVTPTAEADGARIEVVADGAIADYKAFTIDNPARIVFDIPGLGSPYKKEQLVPVNSEWVTGVRYYGYPDKLRMVLDTKSDCLEGYTATPTENGLVILVSRGEAAATAPATDPEIAVAEAEPEKEAEQPEAVEVAESTAPAGEAEETVSASASSRPRWLNRLDFTSEDSGASTLLIGTTDTVDYSVDKSDPVKIRLTLENTRLPKYRKRPLITTRFESAVNRVLPVQTAKMNNTASIVVELREAVPFTVTQEDNLLLVSFEASTVPPKPLEQAALPDWQTVTEEVLPDPVPKAEEEVAGDMPVTGSIAAGEESEFGDGENLEQKYTGEKIALDFYETDIKNVFRILRDVSGMNFAIDKNVTGKVTLTLERPVPWDQVLDLVLKMNQLGKVYEGDIVRIATLATIKREAKLRREKLAAEQKAKQQQEALEPLVTEYIPVNYSTAGTEILPHIENLSTKGRGSITVDERNNQLIITDTVGVIEKMKAIVAEIDRVTPQVIIEARVVEANSDFSREVGFDWGTITVGPWTNGLLSQIGTLTMNLSASNLPSGSAGEVGFTFQNVAGTPFSIVNARLQANESQGNVKIISSPKIITLDNKQAKIKQGVEWPYLERDSSGNSTVKFKDIDLLLEVTPHVTPDNRISMGIYITKNDVGTVTNGVPSLTTNEAETELLVNDGDTIVIGGIIKTTLTKSGTGIPGLRDVPAVGWLFGSSLKSNVRQELLIFISPRIVQLEQRTM